MQSYLPSYRKNQGEHVEDCALAFPRTQIERWWLSPLRYLPKPQSKANPEPSGKQAQRVPSAKAYDRFGRPRIEVGMSDCCAGWRPTGVVGNPLGPNVAVHNMLNNVC